MTLAHDADTETRRGRGGRPTEYKPEYAKQAAKLCELGASDYQLAEFFQVDQSTIENWRIHHEEFFRSVTTAKASWDDAIEQSLFRKAAGYTRKVEKVFCYEGEIVRADTLEHCPPDTGAIKMWLANRRPERWRDTSERTHKHEITFNVGSKLERVLARRALDAPNTIQAIEHKPAKSNTD